MKEERDHNIKADSQPSNAQAFDSFEGKVVQQDFDDFVFSGRIKTLVEGNDFLDPDGMTKDETAIAVFRTLNRQIRSGTPSRDALEFVAYGLDRYLRGLCETLDESFFLSAERRAGGQARPEALDLAVCAAYSGVIRSRAWSRHSTDKTMEYSMTEDIKKEAESAALDRYYQHKNKPTDDIFEREKRFTQTIRPILQKYEIYVKKRNG